MKTIQLLFISSLTFICLTACAPRQLTKPQKLDNVLMLYSNSVGDAAKPQPWEISNNLTAINDSNSQLFRKEINGEKYILVSSWKADSKYYKNDPETGFYNTGKYPIWVTAAPDLQNICRSKKFGRREGLDLRLKQLFGMPPDVEKKYFVEFWVRPQDLFRPCPDAEVSDKNCGLAFPDEVSEEHRAWVNKQRLESYYNPAWNKNYPWTQLGYTYDWHPRSKDHIGLSEFVIGENKNVVVKGFQTTEEYCSLEN
ncbi:MAG: hypothetical protein AAFZ15_05400 [Bacteroidota bacterium]